MGVQVPSRRLLLSSIFRAESSVAKPQISNKSLPMLMIAVDKPIEAVAMQMIASRKLNLFVRKVVTSPSHDVLVLSMITFARRRAKPIG